MSHDMISFLVLRSKSRNVSWLHEKPRKATKGVEVSYVWNGPFEELVG